MKKRFTSFLAALALLVFMMPCMTGWGQVSSVAPVDGNSYVVAAYVNNKYYALPNGTVNGGTIVGVEITLNSANKVSTSDASGKTWTLEEGTGTHSGQYYIKYTSGSDTYYLYKNGTGGTNYNFAVNKTSKNYWSFTTNGTGYTVTAIDRGSNNLNIQCNSGTFRCYSTATPIILLEIGDATPCTVTLGDDNTQLTETSAGAGVTLPSRSDVSPYTFAGWITDNITNETTTAPETIIPAGTYYPTANITLYPVYTRTVASSTPQEVTASVSISDYATANSWENGNKYYVVNVDSNVNVTTNEKGTTGQYNSNGNYWGMYQTPQNASEMQVNATVGNTLNSVTFTYTSNNNGVLVYNSSQYSSGAAVSLTGNQSDTFTVGNTGSANNGQARITAISITYTASGGSTTYYWSSPVAPAVATPVITVAANPFYFSTTATITCATDGATIKYSFDGETWSNYSAALTITETTTVYAKAIKDDAESSVASVDITKNLAEPTVTIDASGITNTNVFTGTTAGSLVASVTYNNEAIEDAIVTWSGNNNEAATINTTTGAVTLVAAGSVTFTATYAGNGDYSEKTATYEMTVTNTDPNAPGTVNNPYTVAQAINAIDNNGNVTGVYATGIVSQVIYYSESNHYINYYISADGTTTGNQLQAYKGKGINGADFSSINDIQVGDVVVINGDLTKYNSIYEFAENNQLVSLRRISIDPTELSFSYVQNTAPGSANEKELTVSGKGLNEDITIELGEGMSAYYELFDLSGDDWTTDPIVLAIDGNGDVDETTIGVRIKSGLGKGVYNGNLNITSGNVSRIVALSGSVTAQLYDITFDQPTGGTLSTTVDDEPVTSAEENADVTLVATPETGYSFNNDWSVLKDDFETPVAVSEGTFKMPNCEVIVSGTFSQINYTITVADTEHGTVEASDETANYGDDIIVTVTPADGYRVQTFTVTETGGAGTVTEIEVADDTYSFDMPAFNITVTVVFEVIPEAYSGGVFELHTGDITEGYYIITYNGYVMKNEISSNRFANGTYPTITNNAIDDPDGDLKDIVWHIQPDVVNETTYWTLYNDDVERYAAGTNTKNQGTLIEDITDMARWTVTVSDGTFQFENLGRSNAQSDSGNKWLRNNGSNGWACYASGTGGALTLYKKLPDVAPTWTSFPTTAGIITGANYELTVSDYVSGNPNPNISISTSVSSDLFEFEDGEFVFQSNDAGEYAFTFNATNTAGSANVTLTITVSAPVQVTYRYSTNGELGAATQITQGESVTLAAAADDLNEDFTFAGWTDNLNDVENNIHAASTSYQVNDNVTLYAVYAHEVEGAPVTYYSKVTSTDDVSEGEFLIVYETGNLIFDGGLPTLDAVGNTVAVTIADATIGYCADIEAAEFRIEQNNTNYTIRSKSGYYIGQTSDANGLAANENTSYNNTIGFTNGNADIVSSSAHLCYNSTANQTRFRYYKSSSYTSQQAIQLYKKETTIPTTTEYYTRVQSIADTTTEITTVTPADLITVPNGAVLTITGACTGTAENLIIEDGGQLIVPNNATVAATFRKEMPAAPAEKDEVKVTGWKLISSPTNNGGTSENFSAVTNLEDGNGYLLYKYDENNRLWVSSQGSSSYNTLNVGQGYLYGNSTGTAIEFTGNVNSAESYSVALSYNSGDDLAGFNVIGNPFSHDIYKGVGGAIDNSTLAEGYYTIENSTWTAKLGFETAIKPGQGILVKTTEAFDLTINNTTANATADKANRDNLMFRVENSEYSDVAYALFDKGYGLNKISHRGNMVPMLYITQNGENYAIAMMDDNTKTFNLGFEAKATAKYTLTYKAKGEFNYLHVIDRMTGEDIDMLLEGEYSFVGSPQDDNNRFIVRLGYLPNYDDNGEDTFAYQNGNDIVVSGEGELQIFDVMGRKVASITINGVETVNIPTQGVYIMKLNEKTQKIVVR